VNKFKSFKEYVVEERGKSATFTFGRFNPPTIGHLKLLEAVYKNSNGKDYFVFASQSNDPKKNPLDYDTKIKYMRKIFPRFARNIIMDKSVKTAFNVCSYLYDKGYTEAVMVVGSDRVKEFDLVLNKYNGEKGRHGFYNFKGGVKVVSAGERDPDADDVSGMSASKMRAAANANDFQAFSSGLPSNFKQSKQLFNDLRKAMGLSETYNFREHIQLKKVSSIREAYIQEKIFNKGDLVIIKESDEVGTIIVRGSNYVIVEFQKGQKQRKWIDDIIPLELIE
jgi:hypothetical protein